MKVFFALVRKQLGETKWPLVVLAASLFAMSWMTVFVTCRMERRFKKETDVTAAMRNRAFLRGMGGGSMDYSSGAIELAFWNHPFLIIAIAIWPIGRASAAIAGEIERGSIDLVLSRPISRTSYFGSQIAVMFIGLLILAVALVAGNLAGTIYNPVEKPPGALQMLDPLINLIALCLSCYGFTVLISAIDIVRWRANLFGAFVTLASYVMHVVANIPSLDNVKFLDHYSIFKAYDPVAAFVEGGSKLAFNIEVLLAIAAIGIAASFVAFWHRDVPSNS